MATFAYQAANLDRKIPPVEASPGVRFEIHESPVRSHDSLRSDRAAPASSTSSSRASPGCRSTRCTSPDISTRCIAVIATRTGRTARPAIRRVGRADDDGAQRDAHRRAVPSGVRPEVHGGVARRRCRAQRRLQGARRRDDAAAARPRRAAGRSGWKKVALLPPNYAITADDLEGCARGRRRGAAGRRAAGAHRLRDAVGRRSDVPRAAGVSKSGNIWAAERRVAAVGADNMAWDAQEERDPRRT